VATSADHPDDIRGPSLNRKFALGTAAGLLISSLCFLLLFVGFYRGQLKDNRADTGAQIAQVLTISLENAMLKRDLEGVRDIVQRLGDSDQIDAVFITNPKGEVRFSSDPERLGQILLPPTAPHDGTLTQAIPADGDGNRLRTVTPVTNKPRCQECHGAVDQNPINGVLYVDVDATDIDRQTRNTTLLLMGAGSLIVILNLIGGWWFMNRFVVRPVRHLSEVSAGLARGVLDTRARLGGGDELSLLGERFNHMAAKLQQQLARLHEKEQFLQQLVDAIPDGIRVIDAEHRVTLSNQAYRRQIGADDENKEPRLCFAATHGRQQACVRTLVSCPLVEVARTGAPLKTVHRHRRLNGGVLDVEVYAAPMRLACDGEERLLIVESIRDLAQEVAFSHEQKLSELGRLAAGIAHEIHNPMAAVRMALHAAARANEAREEPQDRVAEYLELVDQEVDKCSQVTERLLKLAVAPGAEQELVQVDEVLHATVALLNWEAQIKRARIETRISDVPLRILATDSELRMLCLNLIQNALHSLQDGGTIEILACREAGLVVIEFIDDGIGIPPEDRLRVFEPFFSRRADGIHGTGLGLPISKSIAEKYGGTIDIEPWAEHDHRSGTRLIVRFPDADANNQSP
jgi:signal transduction histidine kinase